MPKQFIVIAGNMGSGKTTLTKMLAERFDWAPHYECVEENPYLADFYADMSRWALSQQIFILSKRFHAHQAILRSNTSAIQDRSIYEDANVFALSLYDQGKMTQRDFNTYSELYGTMTQYLSPPTLIVYMRRSLPCLTQRIKERGRAYEQSIPLEYLERLNQRYEDWISGYRLGKVLTVHADNLDFKGNRQDFDYVCAKLENSLEQPELFSQC